MVKICGEMKDFAGKNISGMLQELDYPPTKVAVEVNEEIVPKANYESTVLQDGDKVEIVSFVGGG